jgi:hypothetical protein
VPRDGIAAIMFRPCKALRRASNELRVRVDELARHVYDQDCVTLDFVTVLLTHAL